MMERTTRILTFFGMCLSFATIALAQDDTKNEDEAAKGVRDPKALDIVKATDTAIKKVKFVKYHSKMEAAGAATRFAMPAEGDVVSRAGKSAGESESRIHVKTQRPGSEESIEFTVGRDGEDFYLIDPAEKKVYVDIDPSATGNRGRLAQGLVMLEFLHNKPFDDELEANTVELQGSERVGDQDCDIVRVVYKGGQGESIWYFSKKDNLPRKRTRKFNVPAFGGDGSFTVTLTDLDAATPPTDDMFKLTIPSGFEKVEDFAPDMEMPKPD